MCLALFTNIRTGVGDCPFGSSSSAGLSMTAFDERWAPDQGSGIDSRVGLVPALSVKQHWLAKRDARANKLTRFGELDCKRGHDREAELRQTSAHFEYRPSYGSPNTLRQ